jgi:hypothetical protein
VQSRRKIFAEGRRTIIAKQVNNAAKRNLNSAATAITTLHHQTKPKLVESGTINTFCTHLGSDLLAKSSRQRRAEAALTSKHLWCRRNAVTKQCTGIGAVWRYRRRVGK